VEPELAEGVVPSEYTGLKVLPQPVPAHELRTLHTIDFPLIFSKRTATLCLRSLNIL
jgi:hypothetical protein